MEDIEDTVIRIIAEYLNVDKEDLDLDQSLFDDLNASEVEVAEIISQIEDEFSIDIDKEEVKKLDKISNLVELVDKLHI